MKSQRSEQGGHHRARKRFGQNFLQDQGVIHDIVAAIAPQADDCMVEIGPGLAALTTPLLDTLKHLHVVEIDRDLIARLKQRFPAGRLTIHEGDALEFDFASLPQAAGKLRIVGNLPYNISTPLLFHLAACAGQVRDMHFMLQKEVVERMVAAPGTAAYGRLSVMLQYRFAMELLFLVPPTAFSPAPKVDSAIVRMVPLPATALGAKDEALFASIVAAAFSQRRKMLRNTLAGFFTPAALQALDIAATARAEELALDDFVRLANAATV
ncbi:S-adenosylmethionine-6-N',N'-adenosyl (rRNA) dimethyltransferase [Sterolibacterium denitrificans]|uniref:Ribosomal RNA small subunit methyltransferase A n=1 Tax=Sterolibacterium denitrificans TaxID=157592 RepID=A0A7Z7HND2_9PROT|nr:16S rRNA (adenine(1518)-N(6)/adenine(1519)-N(6))-dimethyltransferase RsmA [Sterolibacterium denitrificans]SMB21074.1 S-adenosylmethionine-6-N',N'-adenosyl (rRNA) dimethyltransferase [Sterolibacterium denitrificans]